MSFDRRHRARLFGRRIYPGEFADIGCHVAGLCFRRIETSPATPFAPYGEVRAEGAARIVRPAPHGRGNQLIIDRRRRSEEHTSELQSLMRTSYAVFSLKKKTEYKNDLRTTTSLTTE